MTHSGSPRVALTQALKEGSVNINVVDIAATPQISKLFPWNRKLEINLWSYTWAVDKESLTWKREEIAWNSLLVTVMIFWGKGYLRESP